MKKLATKHLRLGLAAALGVSLFGASNFAKAGNDNVDYSFYIKSDYGNTYSESRYRQTTNTANQWKAILSYSSEGSGTYTTFWIDRSGSRVSETYPTKQGVNTRDHNYHDAWGGANQNYVRLGAENNNLSSSGYSASGYWDEETN